MGLGDSKFCFSFRTICGDIGGHFGETPYYIIGQLYRWIHILVIKVQSEN